MAFKTLEQATQRWLNPGRITTVFDQKRTKDQGVVEGIGVVVTG